MRNRPRLTLLAVAALVVVLAGSLIAWTRDGGARTPADAGRMSGLAAAGATTTTSSTTTTPPPPVTGLDGRVIVEPPHTAVTTTVATARVPVVTVVAQRPGAPAEASTARPNRLSAIPRPGLDAAGANVAPGGWTYRNPTYFGNPLTFMVTRQEGEWLQVQLLARPNEQTGWIKASDVTLSTHSYDIVLSLDQRYLWVYDGDQKIAETDVVVGTPGSPTPTGRYYVTEKLPQKWSGGSYGPWIMPTSAYSESLDKFDGGLPQVALHGTNIPQYLGQAVSNGCIRLPNEVISQLAGVLPAGTPIAIQP